MTAIENGWVNLHELLSELFASGINNVMVEGGSRILSSFLSENLADQLVVTISPLILGGLRAINCKDIKTYRIYNSLNDVYFQTFGNELLIRGDLS